MRQAILLPILLTLSAAAAADDWPQWRGPNRDGKSAEKGLLKQWPKAGPPVAWKVSTLGAGYSAPSIADGKVFLMGNGTEREWIVCLDEKDGKQIWACSSGRIRSGGGGYPGPRSTPTYANGKIYAMGLAGRLVCCDAKTGKPFWWREMAGGLGGKQPQWGYSESVLVDGDRVICTPGLEKTVVALEAKSGKEIWAAKAGDPASYSSVVKAELAGTPQYVVFTQKGLLGVQASDGAVLWRYDAPSNGQANIPTPVVVGSTVFAASGYGRGGGCAWIRKDDAGAFTAKEMYFTSRMQNQLGGFVVLDNHLYGCCDPGMLVCMNYKTGAVTKAFRAGRFSIGCADGMLYLRYEDGKVDLYDASATAFTRRGTLEQPDRSKLKAWPPPVIANGRLYLRDQYLLVCYDIAEKTKDGQKPAVGGEKTKDKPATPKPKTPAEKPNPFAEKPKTPAEKPAPPAEKSKTPAGGEKTKPRDTPFY